MRNAIIYLTHHANEHDDFQLTKLTDVWNCKECENDIFVVMDVTNNSSNQKFHIHNLSSDKIKNVQLIKLTEKEVTDDLGECGYVMKYYETTQNPLFYGNCMLMIMYVWNHLLSLENYDYVWVIEHDVYYKGSWSYLFDFFADKTEDFIPAQINEYSKDFWHARQYDFKENIPLEKFLISFNPIMRLSKRALNVLDKSYRSGSSGFYEIFLATLFNSLDGMSQKDICAFGFADRERFTYIKRRSLDKKLIDRDNYLYHPIKNVLEIE